MKRTMLGSRAFLRHGISFLALAVFVWVWLAADTLTVFIHLPSLLLTVGGPAAVTVLSFPGQRLRALASAVRDATHSDAVSAEIAKVKLLAHHYRTHGTTGLEAAATGIENPFLRRGVELITEWRSPEETQAMLRAEHVRTVTYYEDCRRILLTIGKLLPAFGLIGTLVSLVLIIRQVNALSAESVGPALSLAILTTLYGAVLANAVVLPLEAKLQTHIDHLTLRSQIGLAATELIAAQAYPSAIESRLGFFVAAGAADSGRVAVNDYFASAAPRVPVRGVSAVRNRRSVSSHASMRVEAV